MARVLHARRVDRRNVFFTAIRNSRNAKHRRNTMKNKGFQIAQSYTVDCTTYPFVSLLMCSKTQRCIKNLESVLRHILYSVTCFRIFEAYPMGTNARIIAIKFYCKILLLMDTYYITTYYITFSRLENLFTLNRPFVSIIHNKYPHSHIILCAVQMQNLHLNFLP